jgi:hypothetical protein
MADRLDIIFAALADPTRRRLLAMLLSRAGLISQEKRGRVKWCKLEPVALRDASVWMQGFGQFEPVNLDAFERFLDTELPSQKGP